MSFSSFGLDKRLTSSLEHLGFDQATPIQSEAIPVAMSGKDILASSQTGSGKTIAFLLPIMQRLLRQKAFSKRDPRALILAPTRELAAQVFQDFKKLAAGTRLNATLIVGGESFNDQAKVLRKEPDIIIATPGRIADHLEHRHIALNALEVLVLDEADRMLDLGFATALRHINKQADHRKRQTMLFSATIDDKEIKNLSVEVLQDAKRIEIGHSTDKHKNITQKMYLADHLDHKEALLKAICEQPFEQMLIFTATKHDSDRLAQWLISQDVNAAALHGDMPQSARNKAMDDFKRTISKVLVATDIAARGLDIKHVSHVVNFDLPKHPEDFIHRIGRTGRAGNNGVAISLVSKKDWQSLERIQLLLKTNFNFTTIEGLQAKFKGIKPKQPKVAKKVDYRKNNKPTYKKALKKDKPAKKLDKSFVNAVEVGHIPMKRKKKD
ncbi:DEAD/DEAH box helicase [Psychrobium sp. 1_MG-2023]|uniref:DEAD/DEAH box helicase n=1 Tax=Psychrobium sp. 1_MG-2023 TaxID=3062624 RepID=UPI0026C1DBE4|nr:DEAD/DEAH box helicase [Psychrobium sp. 1_MG-2023]MDP2560320.1 DEAD/DEAH box helicase [Psychrobium sp. 1_MG-2023]